MPARARASREYSSEHRKARKTLLPYAIGTYCPCGMSGCTHGCDGLMSNPARMDCDDIVPIVLGGTHDITNKRIICSHCNRSAGATLGNQLRGWRASRDW